MEKWSQFFPIDLSQMNSLCFRYKIHLLTWEVSPTCSLFSVVWSVFNNFQWPKLFEWNILICKNIKCRLIKSYTLFWNITIIFWLPNFTEMWNLCSYFTKPDNIGFTRNKIFWALNFCLIINKNCETFLFSSNIFIY